MCTASTDNDCTLHLHTHRNRKTPSHTHTHRSTLCHWARTSLKDWKQLKLSSAVALGRPVAARGELPLCISLSVSATRSDMRGSVTALSETHKPCHGSPCNVHTSTQTGLCHTTAVTLNPAPMFQCLLLSAEHRMRLRAEGSQHRKSLGSLSITLCAAAAGLGC